MYRKWVMQTVGMIVVMLMLVAGVNSVVDPLQIQLYDRQYPPLIRPVDDRQQKINRITFAPFEADALIVGSSRTAFINARDFSEYRAHNLAVSGMLPEEYNAYIKYAKHRQGSGFSAIIIGLDFEGSNQRTTRKMARPEVYIAQANSAFYRLKTLLNWDVLLYSRQNLTDYWTGQFPFSVYDRHGVRYQPDQPPEVRGKRIEQDLNRFRLEFQNYEYNEQLPEMLQTLRDNNPNTHFLVFTTPVSQSMLDLLVQENRSADYEHWLRDVVGVFGQVHHFMYRNSVTTNPDYFMDAHHYHPEVGTWIARRLTGQTDAEIPEDFGIVLTQENLEVKLAELGTRTFGGGGTADASPPFRP